MFDNRRVSGDLQIFCDRDKNQSRTNYVVLQPELGGSKGPRKISFIYSSTSSRSLSLFTSHNVS